MIRYCFVLRLLRKMVPLASALLADVTPSESSHINVDFFRSCATDEDLPCTFALDATNNGSRVNQLTRLENGLDTDNEARIGAPVALETDIRLSGWEMLGSRPGSALLGVRSRPSPMLTLADGEGDNIRESS
jgi:hypothetical protein